MTAPNLINHRRDRQQTRRSLAEFRTRYRDLAGSFPRMDGDLSDPQHPLGVFPAYSPFEWSRR